MAESEYPVSEKLAAIHDERIAIVQFIDWLSEQGITLAAPIEEGGDRLYPISEMSDTLIMRHFEIDERELERERRRMLAGLLGGSDG